MALYDQKQGVSDFRVGIIAFTGLVFLILGIVFAGGDKGLIFKKTSTLKALLSDVGGLKRGGSVAMNGMIVGRVMDVSFSQDAQANGEEKNRIEVTMEVRSDMRERIRADSVPAVRTQGMLGDRYIDIPPGTEAAGPLAEGQVLIGASATDFDKTLNQAISVLSETQKILSAVNAQRGTIGQLVYDQEFYHRLNGIAKELRDLLQDFKKNPKRYIDLSVF